MDFWEAREREVEREREADLRMALDIFVDQLSTWEEEMGTKARE